jgi:hypothetical protein
VNAGFGDAVAQVGRDEDVVEPLADVALAGADHHILQGVLHRVGEAVAEGTHQSGSEELAQGLTLRGHEAGALDVLVRARQANLDIGRVHVASDDYRPPIGHWVFNFRL